eukprot:6270992-Lingulodinium_polyedra.AAC.1
MRPSPERLGRPGGTPPRNGGSPRRRGASRAEGPGHAGGQGGADLGGRLRGHLQRRGPPRAAGARAGRAGPPGR